MRRREASAFTHEHSCVEFEYSEASKLPKYPRSIEAISPLVLSSEPCQASCVSACVTSIRQDRFIPQARNMPERFDEDSDSYDN